MSNSLKYFTFVTSILTLFFVCHETFAQVPPNNTTNNSDINEVVSNIRELKENIEELKKNKKDNWDKFNIIASLLIPASITFFGFYYSNATKKMEIEREAASEVEKALINAGVRKAEVLSRFVELLISEDSRKRTFGVKVISLTLPEESEALVAAISEYDSNEEVQTIAKEALKVLKLENLVTNKYELEHLYRIYEGEQQTRKITFKNRSSFRAELRHLRYLGLIENQSDKTIGGMPRSGDLRDYVKLTQAGIDYIETREENGLENPRREKNYEFWSSANKN